VKFALVDAVLTDSKGAELELANVQNLEFDAAQAAFLAGYLAASQATGASVGVLAGAKSQANYRQVWAFKKGIECFDAKHFKTTVLIGAMGDDISNWNFAGNNPTNQSLNSRISGIAGAGATVIYPVGLSGLLTSRLVAKHPGVLVIGSDSDWWAQSGFSSVKGIVLASITKKISDAVVLSVGKAVAGTFVGGTGGNWLGTLQTGDVSLSVQHDVIFGVGIQGELDALKSDITNGNVLIPELPTGLAQQTQPESSL
jgi:basic membrane protein A